jgi:excisionase family DNA binding protein
MKSCKQPPPGPPHEADAGLSARKLTVKQAAERAGVSPALVYRWCQEQRLVHYRLGGQGRRGKILIDPADLDAFLKSLKVEAGGSRDHPDLKHIILPRPS